FGQKKWLLPLLLTCKALYHAVLPHLYRSLEITINRNGRGKGYMPDKLLQMLDSNNSGLQHVREVILYESMEHSTPITNRTWKYLEAAALADSLPTNVLKSFR
ncbi:MAG: hypothetical protein Q9183_005568, partial [Haloplaca sp. 2 TL-2023]